MTGICYSCLFLAFLHVPLISALNFRLNFSSQGFHETDLHLIWHVSLPFPPVSIQIVSTSNASQTVTLVYVVGNRSSFLNGTVASSLLRQLSAELVGFYLTYPPLTIAEREYVHPSQGHCLFPSSQVPSPFNKCLLCQAHTNSFIVKQLKSVINGDWIDNKCIAHWTKALVRCLYSSYILCHRILTKHPIVVQNVPHFAKEKTEVPGGVTRCSLSQLMRHGT